MSDCEVGKMEEYMSQPLPNEEKAAKASDVDAMVSGLLPTINEAGVIAVSMSEHLTAQEQSFFIAGFQECIKYLMQLNGNNR